MFLMVSSTSTKFEHSNYSSAGILKVQLLMYSPNLTLDYRLTRGDNETVRNYIIAQTALAIEV